MALRDPEAWGMDVIRFSGPGQLPTRAYPGDAGFDLYTYGGPWTIPPRSFVDIDCGVKIQLPEGVWAMVTGRSSTLRTRGLLVHTGVIDQGYRGPLFAGVWNLTNEAVHVHAGDRLAQLIPYTLTATSLQPVKVDSLDPSERGTRGFGSSGT